jgi:predicted restriction endonuclease
LFEHLADNPERLIPFPEVSDHMGFDNARSLAGLLGAFGRRANHRYGGNWPFEAIKQDGIWHLFLSQKAADIVNGLR